MKEFLLDLKVSFRNRIDYFRYGHKIGYINLWRIAIDLAILAYAISNYETLMQTENLLLFIILFFSTYIWQALSFIKDFRNYTKKTCYYNLPTSSRLDSVRIDSEINSIYSAEPLHAAGTTLVYSAEVNRLLQSSVPIHPMLWAAKEKRVTRYIRNYRDTLLPFLNLKWHEMNQKMGSFYNERKLCMASEFEEDGDEYYVKVCRGNYYNSYLTNFIYSKKLCHDSELGLEPPTQPIRRLDKSVMGDHIGISTLAISADGQVIILRQNNKAVTSANLLTPSASGSIDYKDLHKESDFRKTLITAAHRELCEETNISAERIQRSIITGFYRDLGRGGKPEFCCVTYLKDKFFKITELDPNSEEQTKFLETFRIIGADERLSGPGFQAFSQLVLAPQQDGEQPSLALYMCFVMLRLFYEGRMPDGL